MTLILLLPQQVGADLTAVVQPGYVFSPNERPSTGTLNLLGQPTVTVSGTLTGTAGIAAGTVNGNLLSDSVPDGITLDYNGNNPRQLEIKNSGVGVNQISTSIAGTGLTGGGGAALSVTAAIQTAAPIGSITMYAGSSVPSGWLECDGSLQLTATYPLLAAVCGTTFGPGDGTHFNLPQLQGNFVRGWAHTETTNDNARAFGSWQYATNTPHKHFVANTDAIDASGGTTVTANNQVVGIGFQGGQTQPEQYKLIGTSTAATIGLTSPAGNTDGHPNNVALMYIIKHD